MINPDLKKRWIAALESGNYPKGKGYLKHGGQYCCLGVLCELEGQLKPTDHCFSVYADTGSGTYFAVPGMSEDDAQELIDLNDDNDSFAPVIKYIKEHL